MRLSPVSQHLLVFISVLSLSITTATAWTAPEIFYPFGSAAGDTNNAAVDDGSSSVIQLLSPFSFFGRKYQQIYVNNNGYLTFNQSSSQFVPYSFPARGSQDIIAGLWTDLDNRLRGVVSYHQYTSGNVLTRATQDINTHFPNLNFTASWVFVATWDKVAYFSLTNTETSFQVVLISGRNFSFILMNYGDIAVTGHPVQAGYDTINSTDYFVIPGSINGSFVSNLRNSSNVNVPGRWVFRVDSGPGNSILKTRAQSTTAQTIFPLITTHSTPETTTTTTSAPISTTIPATTSSVTTAPTTTFAPIASPLTTSVSTTLAALLYDPCYNYTVLDDLRRATDNQLQSSYYGQYTSKLLCDTYVNWVGWYRLFIQGQSVQMPDTCVDQLSCGTHAPLWLNGQHPRIEDGVVTRSVCGHWSNNCCYFQSNPIKVKACPGGYYVYEFVRPVNCFLAYCAAPAIFYPFGSAAGDTNNTAVEDGSSSVIQLLSPFLFFGRTYQQIYVNNNGYLTFNQASNEYVPYSFPASRSQDVIAGLWTDLDNRQRGVVSYHQYTSGNVLTRATRDINTHFPNLYFTASWVFVATWNKVAYYALTSTETSFQVVLISGHNVSFILMNYGDIAVTGHPVQAGYDTINSTHYFVIPGSINGSFVSNLRNSSNVNVPGQWVFRVDGGSNSNKEYITGLQVKLSSFSDLSDTGNIQIVLQQIKQELVKYGLQNSIELKLRKLQKIKP
ncbi:uncharacterized protein LOC132121165 [Carassius carassius]|uniref:uncharacterized protein LOC132121165 n=1 Tax=Carassius carassius TaxID=217509 RepID=UPI002868B3DB|nr:uncharacterized protein LOC132121165 [Carassius carassius]